MLGIVISSTVSGTLVCILLILFKNRLLSLLGGRRLYYLCLFSLLLFVLPVKNLAEAVPDFDVVMSKPAVTTEINVTDNQSGSETTNAAVVEVAEADVVKKPATNNLPGVPNMVRRENPVMIWEILAAVWLLGFIISIMRYLISYLRFKRRICNFETYAKVNGVRIIKSPFVLSPMMFGFFRPVLAIPVEEMNEADYELAVRHEMMHYKHHDSWLKLYAVLINSLCWFNPVTYFMVNLIGEVCEYACDEQVTKEMDKEGKRRYSEMILTMVCQKSPSLSSNMAKNKKQLMRRFEMIMKTRKKSIFTTIVCMTVIVVMVLSSISFANTVEPLISSLLNDDYVYISTWGYNGYDKGYNEFVPIERNGEYYLPLREFMNKSDIENDKIKYDNGTITIEIWSDETTLYSVGFQADSDSNSSEPEKARTIPSEYSWSTTCKIGSKEVEIAGEKYTLANAPYLKEGITYVPYEYLKKLKLYENKAMSVNLPYNRLKRTSKFTSLMLFGFESADAEYYTDYIQMEKLFGENPFSSFSSMTYNADARISKTGYRTEFEASYNYFDLNDVEKEGSVKIKLNKVTRIYSKGSDLEGLFTVEIDGETLYYNQKGYMIQLPIPAGDGALDFLTTRVKIGDLKLDMFFNGFTTVSEEYDEKAREVGKMSEYPETVKKFIVPTAVKLNGVEVTRGNKSQSNVWYNKERKLIDASIQFDTYNGNNGAEMEFYRIHSELDSKLTVIDENTFATELYFTEGNNIRIDSFDAVITFLPDGKFELKSTDGKYIVEGTAEEFVPQWQWSEEQENAPVPQVVMIGE